MKDKNNIWLFHEINDSIMESIKNLSKNNPTDIFTFDDGLYSNYKYLEELKKLPNKKIFFISLGIVRPNYHKPNKEFILCSDAHKQSSYNYYMSSKEINEIENLDKKYNCFIGLHGVDHIKCSFKGSLISKIKYPFISSNAEFTGIKICLDIYKEELDKMFVLADIFLNKKALYFAWPYNIENDIMKNILIQKTRTLKWPLELFGKNRIEFDNSLHGEKND